MTFRSSLARSATAVTAALAVCAVWTAGSAPAARADSAPADPTSPATPATVTADALPTVQINGVVWSQVVVGTTVYATGSFTKARPAGAPAGQQETVRNNLLAYDIRTGNLITSFAPSLGAQGLAIAASPDGSRIYVGGQFEQANGEPRYSLAAYDTATGALVSSFQPIVGANVRAIAVTKTAVYIGGDDFGVAGGAARNFLAAFDPATGAALSWAPIADNAVDAIAVTPDGKGVVVGGHLTSLNGTAVHGLGEVDAVTGKNLPFAASTASTDGGTNSGFTGISVDNDTIYASAYSFDASNLEGMLAIDPNGGTVKWVDACHGDSYSVWASGSVAYQAGHTHDCTEIGGFPQTGIGTDQSTWDHERAVAFSKAATGHVVADPGTFVATDDAWVGQPSPSLLNWFPTLDEGTYTGQYQGPWNVTGTSQYVVYGGEFPTVNGTMQQGLVRFAVPSIAPNKIGPNASTGLVPTATSWSAGTVRVSWQATSDRDNATLSYDVYRSDKPATPVATVTGTSTYWSRPTLDVLDRTAPAGQKVSYSVKATDPFGNSVTGPATAVTVSTATGAGTATDAYSQAVVGDGATHFWRLGESTGTTSYDQAGTDDLTLGSGVTLGRPGALSGLPNTAAAFSGTSAGTASTTVSRQAPGTTTVEAWFSTTSKTGGKLVGYGNASTGLSSSYDRQLQISATGQLSWWVSTGQGNVLQSATGLNDGTWHHVAGTLGPAGTALYVDGKLVASKAGVTSGANYSGYWRVGGDRTSDGSGPYVAATLDEVAVYPSQLSATTLAQHYALGTGGTATNQAPTASFTSSVSGPAVSVDGSASADADGTVASYAWDFGDGSTGTGRTASHSYTAAGTFPVTLTVTDNGGATGSTTKQVTVAAAVNQAPTASFTSSVSGLAVSVDGSASADADGAVASYAWDFGDGSTGTGRTASHSYTAAGTFPVKLTVTDNGGATGSTSKQVTVTAPVAGTALASDAFGRTATGSWGSADTGGAWSVGGDPAGVSVSGGTGVLTASAANGDLADLGISARDVAVQADVSLATMPTGGGTWVNLAARNVGGNQYNVQLWFGSDGTVWESLLSELNGTETDLGDYQLPITYKAGTALSVRLQAAGSGTTTLQAKAWTAGTAEPGAWQLSATDSAAALQRAGGLELQLYVSRSATAAQTLRVDNVWAGAAGTTPGGTPTPPPATNAAPTASFTATVNAATVSVNASASKDTDGTVASYAWDFGDGKTGTGVTATHTYAASGTYTVKLTVTDNAGATGTASRAVTATVAAVPPPAGSALATDAFGRTVTGGWGTADAGGVWSAIGTAANLAVGGGTGQLTAGKGVTTGAQLGLSTRDVAYQADVSLDKLPSAGGSWVTMSTRVVDWTRYETQLYVGPDGTMWLSLQAQVNGAETDLGDFQLPGTYTAGTVVHVRTEASGSGTTTLHAMAWTGTAEPTSWQLSATDTTAALQRAGALTVDVYQSSSAAAAATVRVDNVWAGAAGTKPA